jgi:hypothetical protein
MTVDNAFIEVTKGNGQTWLYSLSDVLLVKPYLVTFKHKRIGQIDCDISYELSQKISALIREKCTVIREGDE